MLMFSRKSIKQLLPIILYFPTKILTSGVSLFVNFLTSQDKKSFENCPKIKSERKFLFPDIHPLNRTDRQDTVSLYFNRPTLIANHRETDKNTTINDSNQRTTKNPNQQSTFPSKQLFSTKLMQIITRKEDSFYAFSLNVPSSSCFPGTIWAPLHNRIREKIPTFFLDMSKDQTLVMQNILFSDYKIWLEIFKTLLLDFFELDSNLSQLSILKIFDKKKCKFHWRCQVMSVISNFATFNVTMNFQKLSQQSDSIQLEDENKRIIPIPGATQTFDFSYSYDPDYDEDFMDSVFIPSRQEDWNRQLAERTSELNQIPDFSNVKLSSPQDIELFLSNLRKNYFVETLTETFKFKSPLTVLELEKESGEIEAEISNVLIVKSKFSGPDFSKNSLTLLKQETVLIHQKHNRTVFYFVNQEGHNDSKSRISTDDRQGQIDYISLLWVNGNSTRRIEWEKYSSFMQKLNIFYKSLNVWCRFNKHLLRKPC